MGGSGSDGARPEPRGARSYDELTERLRLLRAWAGLSYREIHRRVVNSRRERGIAELPVQDTVHRCMQPGRTRLDVELIVDIARVLLGDDETAVNEWRHAYQVISGEATDAAMVTVLDTLPDDIGEFTGRRAELERLLNDGQASVSAIEGMAGVGKTKLAMHAAHQMLERGWYADVQLVADLRGYDVDRPPADPSAVLDAFLRRLGVPGSQLHGLDLPRRKAKFQELLTGKAVLLILDNAASEDQVRPLLPDSPTCRALVTSRRRLEGLPAAPVSLQVFSSTEAVELLRRRVGADRIDADLDTAARIAELVGHLPLALALTASRIEAKPGWTLTDHLERLGDRRTTLRLDDGVEVALATSYDDLTSAQQELLRLLALHPGRDVEAYATAALIDTDVETAAGMLAELRTANLLVRRSADRFEFHDLVRVFAIGRAHDDDAPASRRAALTRLFDFYRYVAAQAMDRYAPQEKHRRPEVADPGCAVPDLPDNDATVRWLGAERANLIAVAVHAAEHEWPSHTSQLSAILFRYFDNTQDHDAEALHLHACRVGKGAERARSLTSLGSLYLRMGRYTDAAERLREAIEIYRRLDDRNNVACALINLGVVLARSGRYVEAPELLRQALAIARELGARGMEALSLGNLGVMCERLGDYDEAMKCAEEAIAVARAVGARAVEGSALNNLGLAYAGTGRHAEAVDCHRAAVDIAREAGSRFSEGNALNNLGAAYTVLGRRVEANSYHQEALAVALETSNRELESEVLNSVGRLLSLEGGYEQAIDSHEQARAIAEELGDRYEQARAAAGVAACQLALGDVEGARVGWKAALSLHTELGTPEADEIAARLHALADPQ